MKNVKSDWYEGFLQGENILLRKGLQGAWRSYNELRRWEGWCNVEYYKGFSEYLENYEERNDA